jgi:hypothetical protein
VVGQGFRDLRDGRGLSKFGGARGSPPPDAGLRARLLRSAGVRQPLSAWLSVLLLEAHAATAAHWAEARGVKELADVKEHLCEFAEALGLKPQEKGGVVREPF